MSATTVREPTSFPDLYDDNENPQLTGFFFIEGSDIELEAKYRPMHPHSVYGVGIDYPHRDELPEWAQTAMALIDMFQPGTYEVALNVGYKGRKYYEFIGPKHED